jgi:putative ABC transport system substrate-binding protein
MRRREFVTILGGAAAASPLAVRAQQSTMPVVGFLNGVSAAEYGDYIAAFRRGLRQAGFIEGQNVAIEYRWAERRYERLAALAAELVARRVSVIVTAGTPRAAEAAKAATSTIPIVFNAGADPVAGGLVQSLNRPGGNLTGVGMMSDEIVPKKFELLHETAPQASVVAFLNNPTGTISRAREADAARALGLELHIVNARDERDFEAAFGAMDRLGCQALVVSPDPIYLNQHLRLVALAARHRIPAIYSYREVVAAGGLMSYGANIADNYRLLGVYAGRILKGEKPGDLPVMRPTKFEFVINLKTANALDLDIPLKLHVFADEVIE